MRGGLFEARENRFRFSIGIERITPQLPADPGLLIAAKWGNLIHMTVGVDPDCTRVQRPCDLVGAAQFLRPDRRLTIVAVAPLAGDRRWPSVGLPAIGREIRLVDEFGCDVQQDEIGELWVRGDPGRTIMKGYYRNRAATAEALNGEWLRTGDYFRADTDGYLYFFDRRKDVIKRGGENISASEVEAVLLGHPDVLEAAVIGVPDPVKDETVKAFIVAGPGASVTEEDLIAYCADRLGKFKVPQAIEFRAELPKTAIGKIEKKRLR